MGAQKDLSERSAGRPDLNRSDPSRGRRARQRFRTRERNY